MRSEDDTREVVALVSIRLELRDADTLNVDIAESNACSIDSDELRLAPIRRHPLHRAANRSLLSKCVGLRQTESIRIESWYTPWIDRMDEQGQPPHSMESQTVKSIFKNAADPAGGPAVLVDGDLQEHIKSDVAVEQIDACQFYSGNPNVEVVEGILHLYKEDEVISKGSVQGTTGDRVQSLATVCSDMICMLSVPTSFTCPDLLRFVAPFTDTIIFIRILNSVKSEPRQYLVLIKFKTSDGADRFFRLMNGTSYSMFEPDSKVNLTYVARVEYTKQSQGGSFAAERLTELPTCPVCLERMDEAVEGVLTILCNHSFHSQCLSKWGDVTCPVCRYFATPELIDEQACQHCDVDGDLWICLICGHIGCGRYADGHHAIEHFRETQHAYSMNLQTQRVWDYAGENYVHRLIQGDMGQDKPVAVGNSEKSGGDATDADGLEQEKIESLTLEFTYILTSQLAEQRRHFEDQMAEMSESALRRIGQAEAALAEMKRGKDKADTRCTELQREKESTEKRVKKLTEQVSKLSKQLDTEEQLNKGVMRNHRESLSKIEGLTAQLDALRTEKEVEVAELRDQIRDIMCHLEAQATVAKLDDQQRHEMEEGHVTAPRGGASSSGGQASKRGNRKKH